MPFGDVGGKDLWYEDAGSGPALVLIHANKAVMDGVAHLAPMEQPEEFAQLVLDFLAEAR